MCGLSLTLPIGRRIFSPSNDRTTRTWDVKTDAAVGKPLEGHNTADGQRITSGSNDKATCVSNSFPYFSNQHSTSSNPMHVHFYAPLDPNGCVREAEGRLLYWIPPDHHTPKNYNRYRVMRTRLVAQGHKCIMLATKAGREKQMHRGH